PARTTGHRSRSDRGQEGHARSRGPRARCRPLRSRRSEPMKPWDRKRAAHLHRRAGFGGSPEELDLAVRLGREGAVSRPVGYEAISSADLEAYLDLFDFNHSDIAFIVRWWYLRMQYSSRPLEEKMVLFWHNHFATSIEKVGDPVMMLTQNIIFRQSGMKKF